MAKVKLADVAGFPEVDEGTYDFEILSGELRQTQAGRPMILWRLGVETPDGQRASVFYNTLLPTPDADSGLGFLKDLVVGVGADPEDFELDDEDPEGTAEGLISVLTGETGICTVTVENDRRNVKILKNRR